MNRKHYPLAAFLTLFCGFVVCCFAAFPPAFRPVVEQAYQLDNQRASVVSVNHEEHEHDVKSHAVKPNVAQLERRARERWARRNPVLARQVVRPGSYVEVAHLVQRDDWNALQPVHRQMLRNLMLDARRGVMGVMPCFAPGTNLKIVRAFEGMSNALQYFSAGTYWSNTSAGSHTRGTPMTLRWSVVPDGTALPSGAGEPVAPSNFKARFNAIYGDEETWRIMLRRVFARYSEISGIRYIEETDDGAPMNSSNPGVAGVRGDVRVGGHHIDGNHGILAFNYYPDNGDMVFDTNDSFYDNRNLDSLGFRNVLAHEHGHGLGFPHVCPVNQTKLMEPFVSYNFDGPQIDDTQNTQRGYGDALEENDTQAGGTDLGTLVAGTVSRSNVSLDSSADQDFFRFSISSSKNLSATLRPQGGSYLDGPQNADGSCSPGTTYNASAQRDLRLAVLNNAGTVVAEVNATGAGGNESLPPTRLTSSSGPFAVRVSGNAVDAIQLYALEFTLTDVAPGPDFLLAEAPTVDDTPANGNGNGRPDPGESSITINVPLRNVGEANATNVQSTLVSLTAGVTVVQAGSSYPDIATNSVANSLTKPVIAVSSSFVCGNPIQLRLDVQSNEGSKSVSFAFTTGQTGPQSTFTYGGSAVAIPDPGTVDIPLNVSGVGLMSDVNVRIGSITHTWVVDLTVTLISPAGTSVTLFRSIGGSGDNFINTVLDDEATSGINLAAGAPFTGTFKPDSPLSAFDGESADGTWKLRVQDAEAPDPGVVNAFSLQISGVVCETPSAGNRSPVNLFNNSATFPATPRVTNEDTPLFFNAANSNRLSINDADAGTNPVQVALGVTNGTLTLGSTPAVLTISGNNTAAVMLTGPQAEINTALDGLRFNPTANASGSATFSITTDDQGHSGTGSALSDTDALTITINAVNDAPIVTTTGGNVTYLENQTATVIDSALTVSDVDSANLSSATVSITSGFSSGQDVLAVANGSGITGSYNANNGVLTLTGVASLAAYQSTLRSVSYFNSSNNPSVANRTITFSANDGAATQNTGSATRSLVVTPVNDAPTLNAIANPAVINPNVGAQTVNLSGITAGGESQTLTVTATSNNPGLIPDPTVTYTSPNTTASLSYTPVANQTGSAVITVTVTDNGGTANGGVDSVSRSFTVVVDVLPVISINDQSIAEGNSGITTATFTVSLNAATSRAVSLNYATAIGAIHSATVGTDYVANSGTLSFAPGETTKTLRVSIFGEALNEWDETFVVNLSSATNATIGDAQGTGTIINDDPLPMLSISGGGIIEGNSGTSTTGFTVVLSAPSGRNISVDYATADGTASAGSDYIAKSGTLSFEPGATWHSVDITIQGDLQHEADETFALNLSNATSAGLASNSGIVTITNDDAGGVSITPTSGLQTTEAGGQATFQVVLSSQPTADVTMTFSSSKPAEGVVAPASLLFTSQNWQLPQTVVLTGVDDAAVDGAQEYRIATTVQSSDPHYGNREVAEVVIVNQDNDVDALGFSLSSEGVVETAGSLTGTITRNFRMNEALTVALNSNSARIGVPSMLTIPAGSTFATFAIEVANNTIADGNHTAWITVNSNTATASQRLTITDDETATLALQLSSMTVAEKSTTTVVGTLTRNTPTDFAMVVNLTSSDLTEARVLSTVTIPAGSSSATFSITPIDDTFADGSRIVTIRAAAIGFATPATANLTITDNEKPTLTLTIKPERIAENGTATATLQRNDEVTSATPALAVSLTTNVLAQVTIPRSINIPARAASVTFPVRGFDDTLADGPRIITVAAKANGYVAGAADVIVTDNEGASTGSIGGKVLLPSAMGSLPVPGVQLTLRRGTLLLDRVTTAASGTYSFRNLPVGSYTVTPVKVNYGFAPTSRSVALTTQNRNLNTVDFVGVPRSQISGVVSAIHNGVQVPLPNINVVARSATGSFSVRTNNGGRYLFDRLPLGTYQVTPLRTGTVFNPKFISVTLTPALPVVLDRNFVVQGTDTVLPTSVQVAQPSATSFNETSQSTLIVAGTASDNMGGSGLAAVTVALGRFSSTGATVPNGFFNWNNRTFLTTDNAMSVESLVSGTNTWKLTQAAALSSLRTLPPGSYGIRATAIDSAGNIKRSVWKRFVVTTSVRAMTGTEPVVTRIKGSGIGLSYALAQASHHQIVLRFTGALAAESTDVARYAVRVHGEVIEIESVGYHAATATVTIGLPEGTLQVGDSVVVNWQDLLDTQGFMLSDKTVTLQAH
jgi:subtilisin-like proprotein convertase family protein